MLTGLHRALVALCTVAVLVLPLPADVRTASVPGIIYVVHAIDTESEMLAPNTLRQHLTLSAFEPGGQVQVAMTDSLRSMFLDSYGNKIKFSWFLLTSELYRHSPDADEEAIFKAMDQYAGQMARYGDALGWHYHHNDWQPPDSVRPIGLWRQIETFNDTKYFSGTDREQAETMLNSLILRRGWYPTHFRAGYAWENTDLSNWLEALIPFDWSNCSPLAHRDSTSPRYDWSRAPNDWSWYRPSADDYQTKGDLRRTIFRCIPGYRAVELDLVKAFSRASHGDTVVVAYYTHSFNDFFKFCRVTDRELRQLSGSFPGVKYRFVNVEEAARAVLHYADTTAPGIRLSKQHGQLQVTSDEPVFGQPYCAVQLVDGSTVRVLPVPQECDAAPVLRWEFPLMWNKAKTVGVAVNDLAGNTSVVRLPVDSIR